MVKKVLIVLLGLIALFLLVGFLLPTTYHVERSRVIAASPEALFGTINDFRQWPRWDPWAGKDQTMKYVYEGSATGKGSVQHFTSENSGEGTIVIVESVPNEKIVMEMDFKMGDEKLPRATYLFAPTGDGKTKVTWRMDGETTMRPIGNYFALVMDSMLGADFERGLENLDKAVTSAPPVVPVEAKPVEVAPVEAVPVEAVPVEAAVEAAPVEAAPVEAAPAEGAAPEGQP